MEIEIGKQGMAGDAAILMRVEVEFFYYDKETMITNKKGERVQSITPGETIVFLTVDGVKYNGRAFAHPTKDRHRLSHWAGRKIALHRAMDAAKMHSLERTEVWCGLAALGVRWGDRLGKVDRKGLRLREVLVALLPMAKGYAALHPVGRNIQMIGDAEKVLGWRAQKRD